MKTDLEQIIEWLDEINDSTVRDAIRKWLQEADDKNAKEFDKNYGETP